MCKLIKILIKTCFLTHCDLMKLYGDMELGSTLT